MPSASNRTEPSRPFTAILDTLQRRIFASDASPLRAPLFTAPAPSDQPAYVATSVLGRLYESMRATRPDPPAPPPPSVKLQDIARELAIRPEDTIDGLLALRRSFAFANHPDRCVDALREVATIRMSVANMLIDRALKAKRAAQSRS